MSICPRRNTIYRYQHIDIGCGIRDSIAGAAWFICFTLPGRLRLEAFEDHIHGFTLLQGPGRGYQLMGVGIAREALDDHRIREPFDEIAYQFGILALLQASVAAVLLKAVQRGALYHIEQVKFHPVDAHGGNGICGCQHIPSGFAWKP